MSAETTQQQPATEMSDALGAFISPKRYAQLLAQAMHSQEHWLQFNLEEFEVAYNRRPFLFKHRLNEHPLFTLPGLFALCRRLQYKKKVNWRAGVIPHDADFDSSLERFRGSLTLDEAIEGLEEKQAYIVINNPESDPQYLPAIEGLLGEIALRTHALDPGMNWYSTYLFISARDALTPYHMDREMNFLLQIRGAKTARLWDPADDEVMTPAEKDELLSYKSETRPRYRAALDAKATIFELQPGLGIHHPFIAPHLVHTRSEVSLSLAITFRTRRSDTCTAAHRINYELRRLGLEPRPVGQSQAVDQAKAVILRAVRRARTLAHRA